MLYNDLSNLLKWSKAR